MSVPPRDPSELAAIFADDTPVADDEPSLWAIAGGFVLLIASLFIWSF